MKFWLMIVLCLPGHKQCEVRHTQAVYPRADWCKKGAEATLYFQSFPHLEGAFCEMARTRPKNYKIDKGELP